MTVGITNGVGSFLPLYINMARTLLQEGHDVIWFWPTLEEKVLIRKYCPQVICTVDAAGDVSTLVKTERQFSGHVKAFYELGIFSNKNKAYVHCLQRYSRATDILRKYKIERLVVFNGCTYPEADAAEDMDIPVWYLENGYFPNTFQCNRKGVNAKADFSNLTAEEFVNFSYQETSVGLHKTVNVRRCYTWYILSKLCNLVYFPKKEIVGLYNVYRQRRNQKRNRNISKEIPRELPAKYLLYPLQCTQETQLWLNSDFDSIESTVEPVIRLAKRLGLPLILKEHPADYMMHSYDRFASDEVFVTRVRDIDTLISGADAVVVMNSSTGLQAAGLYKPVLTFGKNMYTFLPNVTPIN